MSGQQSRAIHDAYYTSTKEVLALYQVVEAVWGDLDGQRLLEPSVGSGAFPKAARYAGINVEWVTNELSQDTNNYDSDFNKDFLELDYEETGPIDLVVGNPPFTGGLAQAFILHSFNFADRVAMVLPPESLRPARLAQLPKDVFISAYTQPEQAQYVLGGAGIEYGHGTEKAVNTVIVLFERRDNETNNYDLRLEDYPGLEFLSTSERDKATHAIQDWGGVNARAIDGSWGREVPYASETFVKVTSYDAEAVLASRCMDQVVSTWSTGSPFVSSVEIRHWINSTKETGK